MIGSNWTPRQRLRAVKAAGAGAALALHVVFALVLRPDAGLLVPAAADRRPAFVVTLQRPPTSPPGGARPAPARRRERDEDRPLDAPDSRGAPRIVGPAAADAWRNPSAAVAANRPGVVWGVDPPGAAAQRALRGTVGCGLEVPLTRREQYGCDERMGRDWRKGPRERPLMADRTRQKELEAQAAYKRALKDYREAPPPDGLFEDLRDMGGQPPRK